MRSILLESFYMELTHEFRMNNEVCFVFIVGSDHRAYTNAQTNFQSRTDLLLRPAVTILYLQMNIYLFFSIMLTSFDAQLNSDQLIPIQQLICLFNTHDLRSR